MHPVSWKRRRKRVGGQVGEVGEPMRGVVGRLGDGGLEGGRQRSRVVFRRRGPGTCIRWTAARLQVQAASSEPERGGCFRFRKVIVGKFR